MNVNLTPPVDLSALCDGDEAKVELHGRIREAPDNVKYLRSLDAETQQVALTPERVDAGLIVSVTKVEPPWRDGDAVWWVGLVVRDTLPDNPAPWVDLTTRVRYSDDDVTAVVAKGAQVLVRGGKRVQP